MHLSLFNWKDFLRQVIACEYMHRSFYYIARASNHKRSIICQVVVVVVVVVFIRQLLLVLVLLSSHFKDSHTHERSELMRADTFLYSDQRDFFFVAILQHHFKHQSL